MGNIYCIMGKSASGKDTIYKRLLDLQPVSLRSIVTYTTRPIRSEETEGVEYKFVNPDILRKMRKQGIVIEERCYHTVHGDWYYFTADDGQIKDDETYLLVQTPEGFKSLRDYYGRSRVRPIYIEVENVSKQSRGTPSFADGTLRTKPIFPNLYCFPSVSRNAIKIPILINASAKYRRI